MNALTQDLPPLGCPEQPDATAAIFDQADTPAEFPLPPAATP
ncbi:MAG: hypothetical protein AB7F35_06555 [Acetobacteraceae bacterium]